MKNKTEQKTHVSAEDLKAINDAKANAAYAKVLSQKAEAEYKAADAEFRAASLNVKNMLLMAYLNYGMSPTDSIEPDGTIVHKTEDAEVVDESK